MKKLRSILLVMLCVVLIAPGMCMNVSAATQKQRALAAYKKWLSKSTVCVLKKGSRYETSSGKYVTYNTTKASKVKFALAYINNDSIPELILYTGGGVKGLYGILTFKNGKVRRVWSGDGYRLLGYYKKTGIFLSRSYPADNPCYDYRYKKMKGTKLTTVLRKFYNGYMDIMFYNIENQESSRKDFLARLKKETKSRSLTKVKFYKNTAANRKARLK